MGQRNRRICRLTTALAACALAFALAVPVLGEPSPAASAPASPPPGAQVVEQGWFAPLNRSVPPAEPKNVFIIPIREDITDKAFRAMERKVITCKAGGADLVILDLHTPGGSPFAARDIIALLASELGDVHTVCFVRSDALSAGAMIALGCDEIVMTPTGTLGACAPILVGGGELTGAKREKYESFLRTTSEQSAKRNGYPAALAVSMVSYDMEVWLVRNKKTRELQYGLRGQWRGRVTIPPGLADVNSNPDTQWELVEVPVRKGRLLTVDADKAMQYSLASAIVEGPKDKPFDALMKRYNVVGKPTVLIDTWSEDLVDVIRSPVVATLLMFGAMMFGYIEMHTPGFGLFGAIAIVCVVILLGSGYLIGLAQAWEIALLVLGLVLIALEIFVIPGFGVAGIAGGLCCVAGLLSFLVANPPGELPIPKTDLDWRVFQTGLLIGAIALIAAVIAGSILSRFLPKIPLVNRIILGPAAAAAGPPVAAGAGITHVNTGDLGVVESMCRPVGKVRFGDDLLDAVSEGETIEPGQQVRVSRHDGNRIIVEKV
jgi:membrane-bound serine protease (ClpP class)